MTLKAKITDNNNSILNVMFNPEYTPVVYDSDIITGFMIGPTQVVYIRKEDNDIVFYDSESAISIASASECKPIFEFGCKTREALIKEIKVLKFDCIA